jgi:phospholipid transport system transporter-binding protein
MLSCADGRCTLSGPVTMRNVTAVLEESRRLFNGLRVVVDLSGVTELDSAAVSLLLEWRRGARAANREIDFVNIPDNLKSLADLYGVSELLATSPAS